MVATDRVRALFADARDLQADALEMLEQAFSATLRRRPGAPPRGRLTPRSWPGPEREPERSSESSTGLRMLESLDPEVRRAPERHSPRHNNSIRQCGRRHKSLEHAVRSCRLVGGYWESSPAGSS